MVVPQKDNKTGEPPQSRAPDAHVTENPNATNVRKYNFLFADASNMLTGNRPTVSVTIREMLFG